jgi:hypothetical protein
MVSRVKFGVLLDALRAKGRVAEACAYELSIVAKFMGVKSLAEIRELTIDELVLLFDMVELLKQSMVPGRSLFADYIADLKLRGYGVMVGDEYLPLL